MKKNMRNNFGFTPLEIYDKTQKESLKSRSLTGFTIIELLVVIAIIGVLAAIVLVNVVRYIDKGKDAAARGDMATLLTNAITFYNESGNFDSIASDDDYKNAIDSLSAEKMGYTVTAKCATADDVETDCGADSDSVKWCASIELKAVSGTIYYCVDSSGAKKESSLACASGVCP